MEDKLRYKGTKIEPIEFLMIKTRISYTKCGMEEDNKVQIKSRIQLAKELVCLINFLITFNLTMNCFNNHELKSILF